MAKRGRPPGFKMPEEHRHKIQLQNILNRMNKVALGEVEASPVSMQAAIALLRKVMPDLQNVEQSGSTDITMRTIVTGVPRHGRDDAAVREGGDALPSRFPDQPPSDVKH